MICQVCRVEASTRYVAFYQNIGALVVRFSRSIQGKLCKSCIHKHFWGMTGTTFVLGWWGYISLVVTPFILLNNIGRYVVCLAMPSVPPGAGPPTLTDEAVERLRPYTKELVDRLNDGQEFEEVAAYIAESSGTTAGQVVLYVHTLVDSHGQV